MQTFQTFHRGVIINEHTYRFRNCPGAAVTRVVRDDEPGFFCSFDRTYGFLCEDKTPIRARVSREVALPLFVEVIRHDARRSAAFAQWSGPYDDATASEVRRLRLTSALDRGTGVFLLDRLPYPLTLGGAEPTVAHWLNLRGHSQAVALFLGRFQPFVCDTQEGATLRIPYRPTRDVYWLPEVFGPCLAGELYFDPSPSLLAELVERVTIARAEAVARGRDQPGDIAGWLVSGQATHYGLVAFDAGGVRRLDRATVAPPLPEPSIDPLQLA